MFGFAELAQILRRTLLANENRILEKCERKRTHFARGVGPTSWS
jgi:hypothetical protein